MIVHRPGKLHMNADGLSRVPTTAGKRRLCGNPECGDCCEPKVALQCDAMQTRGMKKRGIVPVESVKTEDAQVVQVWEPSSRLSEAQGNDVELRKLREMIRGNEMKPSSTEMFAYSHEFKSICRWYKELKVIEGVLVREWEHGSGRVFKRVVVPMSMRSEIFKAFHGTKLVGHYGIEKVLLTMKQKYYWPGMANDIENWSKACESCTRNKDKSDIGRIPLKKELHGERWSRIAMDVIGPFPESEDRGNGRGRNNYCLVVVDFFTKWAEGYALVDHTAETVAETLIENWLSQHGCPDSLQSDGAPEFVGSVLNNLAAVYDYERLKTLPYRPQSNGQVERMNRTLLQQLSCLCMNNAEKWDQLIPHIFSAYRCCVQKSTGLTPFYMVYGSEMKLPVDLRYQIPKHQLDFPCAISFVENIRRNMKFAGDFARKKLELVAQYQKRGFDSRARERFFEPGDLVFKFDPPSAQKKIGPKWDGAYEILDHTGAGTYKLRSAVGTEKFHVDYLKPVFSPDGNIRITNLWRAPEYRRQMSLGIEFLKFDKKGRVMPGKDCPATARRRYEEFGALVGPKRRTRWVALNLDEQGMNTRPWTPAPRTSAEVVELRRILNAKRRKRKRMRELRKP